jgi:hypothetical protein
MPGSKIEPNDGKNVVSEEGTLTNVLTIIN